jgi:DNA topoisomerase IB
MRKNIKKAVEVTAGRLGHIPSICRSTYINPNVFKYYQKGEADKLKRYFDNA